MTTLLELTKEHINWNRSLLRKVWRLTPGYLLLNVSLFTISQVTTFLAFFLPLKVLFMVATEGIPGYLRFIVTQENKNWATLGFGIGTVICYALHLLTEQWAEKYSHKAGTILQSRTKKLAQFNNESQLAKSFFLRLSRSLGGLVMVAGGYVLGFYLSLVLFGSLLVVVILEYLITVVMWNRLQSPERMQDRLNFPKRTPNLLKFYSSVNFFVGFCLLLLIFFFEPGFGLIRGILCFILMRQVMQRLQGAIQDTLFLHQNKPKINALFYTSIYYQPQIPAHEHNFLDLLRPTNREKWLGELVHSHGINHSGPWRWLDIAGKNIALLWAEEADNVDRAIYFKIYSQNQELVRNHEKMIFDAFGQDSLLLPEPLAECQYLGFQILIFRGPLIMDADRKKQRQALEDARGAMWSMAPQDWFVSQCCRTRPLLPQRLTHELLSQLFIGAEGDEEQAMLQSLLEAQPILQDTVTGMPLIIHNPALNLANMALGADEHPMLFAWPKWSLEPLGVGVPFKMKREKLQEALDRAAEKRPEFQGISLDLVLLTSMASQVEDAISGQNFKKAMQVVPYLLEGLNNCRLESKAVF